ncbi:MAG: hypothetical protein WD183_05080 [Nitrosopumilaceae archaeon]
MDSPPEQKIDPIKHCQIDEIKICTKCGSNNIKIDGDNIYCNDCHAILCFEHKK